jgi:hypothetical protein
MDALHYFVFPLMLCLGLREVWKQHVRLTRWRPTWAAAVQAPGIDLDEVRPVALTYEVAGRRYKHWSNKGDDYRRAARRVLPATPDRARRLEIEILYDPTDPGDALVGRDYRFGPYFFLGMSAMLVAAFAPAATALLSEALGAPPALPSPPPSRAPSPPWPRRRRILDAFLALAATATGAAGLLHFFAHAAPPYDGGARTWTAVYAVLALAIVVWTASRAAAWSHKTDGLDMMNR